MFQSLAKADGDMSKDANITPKTPKRPKKQPNKQSY